MYIDLTAQAAQRSSRFGHFSVHRQKVAKDRLKERSDVLGPLQGFIPRPTRSMMGQPREGGGGPSLSPLPRYRVPLVSDWTLHPPLGPFFSIKPNRSAFPFHSSLPSQQEESEGLLGPG